MIQRLRTAALAVTAVGALVVSAVADPFTPYFSALYMDLDVREAALADSPVNAANKKRIKAINAAQKALDFEGDDLGDDLKAIRAAGKALRTGYGSAFLEPDDDFPAVAQTLHAVESGLDMDISAALQALAARIPSMSEKGGEKLQKIVNRGQSALMTAAGQTDPVDRASSLLKAWNEIRDGSKLADKDPGTGESTVSFGFDQATITGNSADNKVDFSMNGDSFALSTNNVGSDAQPKYLVINVPGVTGRGTYDLTAPGIDCFVNVLTGDMMNTRYDVVSGTLTITSFDVKGPTRRIVGTFSFEARSAGGDPRSISGGQFDVANVLVF